MTITTSGDAPDRGVIHDIGYRHYTGARLGRRYIVTALYVDSLRGAYGLGRSAKSKIIPMGLFILMVLPAAILVLVTAVSKATEIPGGYTSYTFKLQALIPVFLAAQAPVVVARDLRFRVMSLYLSRPLRRDDYVLAKFGAFATAVFALLVAPLLVMFIGALLLKLPLGEQLSEFLPALAGDVLFALVLAAIAIVIASVTPRRGFGVAAIVTVLTVATTVGLSAEAIAAEHGAWSLAGYLGLISPFSMVQGVQTWMFGADNPAPAGPQGTAGGLLYTAVTAAVLACCYGFLLLRYRKVSVS